MVAVFILGGQDGTHLLNDVWSSVDGAAWTQSTAAAIWPARWGHTVSAYSGQLWLTGGATIANSPLAVDLYTSTDGGLLASAFPSQL